MERWIIGSDGRAYGPADTGTLRRWITEGRVIATTPVSKSPDGPWNDAVLDPELAAEFARSASDGDPSTAPPSGSGRPPTTPVAAPMPPGWPPDGMAIPQLVSGIFNLVTAAGWLFTCFGIILTIPLAILGVNELLAYSRARTTPPSQYLESARTFAILDICSILAGNIPSAVCGIVVLTQLGAARERATQR